MAEYFSKRDREKKKQQARKEKEEKKRERKDASRDGNSLAQMMAYVDENGNLTSIPQDLSKRREVNIDEIQIGVPKGEDRSQVDEFEEVLLLILTLKKVSVLFENLKQSKVYLFILNNSHVRCS